MSHENESGETDARDQAVDQTQQDYGGLSEDGSTQGGGAQSEGTFGHLGGSSENIENVDAGTDAAQPEATDLSRVSDLEAGISALEAENSELKEQYLRKQADFENFRKRMQREREDSAKFANKELLLDIVPVIDDFERAIVSANDSRDFASFYDGIVLIEKQLAGMLERKWGLRKVDSVGSEFDPQQHEAVAVEPRSDVETATVLEDFQKGYFLHDKVLRSAKVKVAMPEQQSASEDSDDETR